jgi:adenylate cyclase
MGPLLAAIPEIEEWLLAVAHVPDGGQSFVGELSARLHAAGLPLWRVSLALLNKHPELKWRTVRWHEDDGVSAIERRHQTALEPYFKDSPVARLVAGAPPIRVPLGPGELPYPICRDLRDEGGTDYFAQGLPFTNGEVTYVSWATRARGGWSDDALAALTALAPALARRIELESAYHATRALLEVYLGRNAARRVMAGAFTRGGGELVDAAIWFCDLRGFTSMSDRTAPKQVVETLDAYFDRVAGAVAANGGEVLKFVGDAILAIFPVDSDVRAACVSARRAAEDGLAALAELNAARPEQEPLAIGVALHLGAVMYGNIGSKERLDFTVISAAVNETCRLESLCKPLGTPLAMSEAFTKALGASDVADLGEQALKGVAAKLRVFTLERLRPPVSSGTRGR